MKRREYVVKLEVNGRKITKVIIDPHYEEKHTKSINDELILELVKLLHKGAFPVQEQDEGFEYFVNDNLKLGGKTYKLIWLLEDNKLYIGVVNAHRRRK